MGSFTVRVICCLYWNGKGNFQIPPGSTSFDACFDSIKQYKNLSSLKDEVNYVSFALKELSQRQNIGKPFNNDNAIELITIRCGHNGWPSEMEIKQFSKLLENNLAVVIKK